MTLREAIDAVMVEKDWDQTELGMHIGAPQSMVSRMRKGDDWELHWQVFLRLLRLLVTLKIIGRSELYSTTSDKNAAKKAAEVGESTEHLPKKARKIRYTMETGPEIAIVLQ